MTSDPLHVCPDCGHTDRDGTRAEIEILRTALLLSGQEAERLTVGNQILYRYAEEVKTVLRDVIDLWDDGRTSKTCRSAGGFASWRHALDEARDRARALLAEEVLDG
jgi:hypothetical protein